MSLFHVRTYGATHHVEMSVCRVAWYSCRVASTWYQHFITHSLALVHPSLLHHADNGTIRFHSASSTAPHSGMVEAFINGAWKNVCPTHVDSKRYMCNQLGYSTDVPPVKEIGGTLRNAFSPDWDRSDKRCQNSMYGTEGCVWYQKGQRMCRTNFNTSVTCSGKYNIHGGTMYLRMYVQFVCMYDLCVVY